MNRVGLCGGVRAAIAFAAVLMVVDAARAADLVDHNGFEACWTHAITEPEFLELEQSAIDGLTSCVSPSSGIGYSMCSQQNCPKNAVGCPVTTHAALFNGAFAAGSGNHHTSSGSTDTITIDVSYFPGSCTITISNVALDYALDYTLQADGNSGLYSVSLDQSTLAVQNGYVLVGSDLVCQGLASSLTATLISQIETEGAAGIAALERLVTVGETVCPVPPG
jgi:hypothetical protein